MHQPFFVSETEMKSAGVSSVLADVHCMIFFLGLRNLSQTRVLAEEKPEVCLDHCKDPSMAVTFGVELMEAVFGATEEQL